MSDERLRELERRWRETNSVEDELAYHCERARLGQGKPVAQWLAELSAGEEARAAALDHLWRLEPQDAPSAVGPLLEALAAPATERRLFALRFLGLLGAGAAEAVPALVAALDDPDGQVRQWAADALGRIGNPASMAIPRLESLTQTEEPWQQMLAWGALLKLGNRPEAIEALVMTRHDPDIGVQCWGLSLLLDVVDRHPQVLSALLAYLDHWYDPHIEDIGHGLAHTPGARQPLIAALRAGDERVRENAAAVLGYQREAAEELVSVLAQALSDPAAVVRWKAAGALSQLSSNGVDVRPALSALRRAAQGDEYSNAQRVSQELLRSLQDPTQECSS